jgi:hypothetical protein
MKIIQPGVAAARQSAAIFLKQENAVVSDENSPVLQHWVN